MNRTRAHRMGRMFGSSFRMHRTEPGRPVAWGTCVLVLAALAACNGSGQGPAQPGPADVPVGAGEPSAVCTPNQPCDPGLSCVVAVGERGRCLPAGTGGGRCRVVDDPAGPCDPGFGCAGKGDTCVPVVAPGDLCVAAACAAGSTCGAASRTISLCAVDGTEAGLCRDVAPLCDRGLGCTTSTGRCSPLDGQGRCLVGGREVGCPDGRVCPREPGGSGDVACVLAGAQGGPCRKQGAVEPRCDGDARCFMGKCDSSVSAIGAACFGGEFHRRCEDGSSCLDELCVPFGVDGGACRTMGVPCDAGLACYMQTCRPTLAQGAACDPAKPETAFCATGTTCVALGIDDARCVRDGTEAGVCRFRQTPSCDPPLRCASSRVGPARCAWPIALGAPCNRARESFSPCESGSACGYGREVCVAHGSLGGRCLPGDVCDEGLSCVADGLARSCVPSTPVVAIGAACDDRPDEPRRVDRCAAGSLCLRGSCVPYGGAGTPCRAGAAAGTCDRGLTCSQGLCQPGLPPGAPCLEGSADCGWPAICIRIAATDEQAFCQLVPSYAIQDAPGLAVPDGCAGGQTITFRAIVDGAHARDEGDARVTLPFAFPFFGKAMTEIAISPNGVVGFPPTNELFSPGWGGNGMIPADGVPALLAPFWDDLTLGVPGDSDVCHRTISGGSTRGADAGVGAGGRFVVEWKRLARFGRRTVQLGFAIALHPDGSVDVVYRRNGAAESDDVAFASGVRAAIGAQSSSGRLAVVHPGGVPSSRALRFVPQPADPQPTPASPLPAGPAAGR